MPEQDPFETFAADPPPSGAERLMLDIDGFEGPLDLLLALAREQKVDLARLSILDLAEQYLAFIARLQGRQLELAADYLVMAAWLAYLKSRLLLPQAAPEDEPSGEEMAAALAFQLRRLEAIRKAGAALMASPRLFRDVWPRGMTEPTGVVERPLWECGLYDLLAAYGAIVRRGAAQSLEIEAPDLYSVDDAIARLTTLLGRMPNWATLQSFLPPGLDGLVRASAISAHFVATLELCRRGRLEIRQDGAFAPLWLKPTAKGGA